MNENEFDRGIRGGNMRISSRRLFAEKELKQDLGASSTKLSPFVVVVIDDHKVVVLFGLVLLLFIFI